MNGIVDSDYVDAYIRKMENDKYNNLYQLELYENLVQQKDQQLREMDAIINRKSVQIALKVEKCIQKMKPVKLVLKGLAKLLRKVIGKIKPKKPVREPEEKIIPETESDILIVAPPEYKTSVSVIYPTKNGGALFQQSIQSIATQLCIQRIEIIVVDSGSEDETINIAEFLGAKIIKIKPEEFSHSYARNLGAKHATGEYLLFMTQDAIPTDDLWLYHLITPLMEKKVVAASAMEIQREFGDLKYKIDNWNHNHYLGIWNCDVIGSMPSDENWDNLRKNAQLADISCLVRKDIFDQYGYSGDFAEDLRLGLDIIRGGNQIALMSSVQVIHAHERISSYYMKRNYVDVKTIKEIFPDYPIRNRGREALINAIRCGYYFVKQIISIINIETECSTEDFFVMLQQRISSLTITDKEMKMIYEDKYMEQLLNRLFSLQEEFTENDEMCKEIQEYIFGGMQTYLNEQYDVISNDLSEQIKETIYKTFCGNVGTYITEYCIMNPNTEDDIIKIGNEFSEGV